MRPKTSKQAPAPSADTPSPSKTTSKGQALRWLRQEGYPLEFRVAHEFGRRGLVLWPSYHAPPAGSVPAREIDLRAARLRTTADGATIGVEFAVECKWTGDAPWIAFVSEYARVSSSTAITNTFASPGGRALLWLLADQSPDVLSAFTVPERPAYGGVRAHKASGKDMVYSTLQGLVDLLPRIYGGSAMGLGDTRAFAWCTVAFPVVVIDGDLFEASYDPHGDDVELVAVNQTRFHWTGSGVPGAQPLVDVVRRSALTTFLDQRISQADELVSHLEDARNRVLDAFASKSLEPLSRYIGNRYTGRPIDLPTALRPILFP